MFRCKWINWLVFCLSAIILIIALTWVFFLPLKYDVFHVGTTKINEHHILYYFIALIFTGLLIAIAYFQLVGIQRNIRAELLLNVDSRWGNRENLDAREYIHEMVRKAEKEFGILDECNRCSITKNIGSQIITLRKSNDQSDIKKFMAILNFLDLMESIGYLYDKGHLTLVDLNELCGHSFKFNFEIFNEYIDYRSNRHGEFYKYFKKTYEDLKSCKGN